MEAVATLLAVPYTATWPESLNNLISDDEGLTGIGLATLTRVIHTAAYIARVRKT